MAFCIALPVGVSNLSNTIFQKLKVATLQVIKLISQVIADFANGEISQIGSLFNTQITMQQYQRVLRTLLRPEKDPRRR